MTTESGGQSNETVIWQGSPSQLINILPFVVGALLFWLVLPPLWALWRWLQTRTTNYRVTTERIAIRTGVLNIRAADMPLYRVKDESLDMPFWLRLFNRGHIDLVTSDPTYPHLRLFALPDPDALRERLHQAVDTARRVKGVRELDIT